MENTLRTSPSPPPKTNAAGAGEVVSGFGGITKMQDMTPSVCSGVSQGTEGRLIDIRDNKIYWVAKLKDNKCWMTQNLDLDLWANGDNLTFTNTDTDVSSEWTSSTGPSSLWPSGDNAMKYFDTGMFIYTTPNKQNTCNSGSGLMGCADKGWINVNGMAASTVSNFSATPSNNTYNAHYLSGNYYSWAAATAGTGTATTAQGTSASGSICPKGWTLPTGGADGRQYNTLANGLTVAQITASPYYFVYGGVVYSSSLNNAGSDGYYWSSTAFNASQAYRLYFDTNVYPSNYSNRYLGHSVRCVAR